MAKYCMFRFNTSVYSSVGTEYELKTQFSLHPYFQHSAVCLQTLFWVSIHRLNKLRPFDTATWCFHYFQKSGNSSHNIALVKKLLKNVIKFYLDRFSNKQIPLWCNVNFESVFSLLFNIVYYRVTGLEFLRLKFCVKVLRTSLFPNPMMYLVNVWYDDRYWSEILCSTIFNPYMTLRSRSRS